MVKAEKKISARSRFARFSGWFAVLAFTVQPLTSIAGESVPQRPVQKQGGYAPAKNPGPVSDEATAIKVAVEYYKAHITGRGPDASVKPKVFKDAGKQWIVSWDEMVVVVNAKTGESYQADSGSD